MFAGDLTRRLCDFRFHLIGSTFPGLRSAIDWLGGALTSARGSCYVKPMTFALYLSRDSKGGQSSTRAELGPLVIYRRAKEGVQYGAAVPVSKCPGLHVCLQVLGSLPRSFKLLRVLIVEALKVWRIAIYTAPPRIKPLIKLSSLQLAQHHLCQPN